MDSEGSLTFQDLMFYKNKGKNKELPSELEGFVNRVKLIQMKNKRHSSSWKRVDRSKTSWLVTKKNHQNVDEKLESNYKGILNRMSESNFDEMLDELVELEITTAEQLTSLIDLIFKKAIMEEKYGHMYSKMCKRLLPRYVEEDGDKIMFRNIFLTKCEETFIESISFSDESDLKDSTFRRKSELITFISFIGKLYNGGILTNHIINNCILSLLIKVTEKKWCSIENACKLVEITGKNFGSVCPKDFASILDQLNTIASSGVSLKEKFAIMDVIDQYKKRA